MIRIESDGNFDNLEKFLKKMKDNHIQDVLKNCAEEGVQALSSATPFRSGATASAWSYEIENTGSGYTIHWTNDNVNKNVNIAAIIQYGHGTRNGGYVQGIDYINPAMRPVFDDIVDKIWREVTSA